MYAEKEHLEAELSGLGKQKDQLAKQLWEEELTTSRAIDRLETKVQQANNCSLRLHLVPADAKHAHGADHEISLDKGRLAADPSSAVLLQPDCTLQHALHRIKGAVGAEVNAAQDHLLEAEEGTAKREEHAVERQEQLATLKASLAKLEKEEKDLRDEHAAILAEKAAETERLEDSIKRAKSVNGQEVAARCACAAVVFFAPPTGLLPSSSLADAPDSYADADVRAGDAYVASRVCWQLRRAHGPPKRVRRVQDHGGRQPRAHVLAARLID